MKMQASSQLHAGFFESNDAIPAQFLAHAQTFDRSVSFLLVDISTSFWENLYAIVSLLRNWKFNLISQSGWLIPHATIMRRYCSSLRLYFSALTPSRCIQKQESEELRKWRSSKVEPKILNKYSLVYLIVHRLSLANA